MTPLQLTAVGQGSGQIEEIITGHRGVLPDAGRWRAFRLINKQTLRKRQKGVGSALTDCAAKPRACRKRTRYRRLVAPG